MPVDVVSIFSAAALVGAAYLVGRAFSPAAGPGCGAGGGCDVVLSSRWSRIGVVPVSAFAVAIYAAMLGARAGVFGDGSAGTAVLPVAALASIGAAVWFMGLQILIIRRLCKFCTLTHLFAVCAAWATLMRTGSPAAVLWAIAGVMLVLLVASQFLLPGRTYRISVPSAASEAAAAPKPLPTEVSLYDGRIVVNPGEWPVLGDPSTAQTVLVEMFDYTCEDCRWTQRLIRQAMRHYSPNLAIVLVPAPLEQKCNPTVWDPDPRHDGACEYARIALAVWRARASAFGEFHEWLFSGGPRPVPVVAARTHAERLVGPAAFTSALLDPAVNRIIERGVTLYRAAEMGNLPKIVLPQSIIWGRVGTAEELYALLEAGTDLTAGRAVPAE